MKRIYIVAQAEKKQKPNCPINLSKQCIKGQLTKLMMQLLGNIKTSHEKLQAIKEKVDNMDTKLCLSFTTLAKQDSNAAAIPVVQKANRTG
ncbi:hypothetical protein [uncultured Pontibacter sp.]|uniref:hypothetical protein n=1 Tax=uncultured Pontibacter sp. TaxID=453356 RepID=UPI0026163736|nr:hypothetical protein [uncultured Pontibacter sp.]